MNRIISITAWVGIILSYCQAEAQIISWGPTSPALTSENINTCYEDGQLSVEFENSIVPLVDVSVEIQLDTGINYVPGSFTYSSSGSAIVTEDDYSNLNRPIFYIGSLGASEQINIQINRTADCEAMSLKIGGSTFIDTTRVYEAGTEVIYSNSITNGTINYDVIYASLSITNVDTDLSVNNLGGVSTRTMNITNGSFGSIESFYFADVFTAGDLSLSNFVINPDGINYSIPTGNITTIGDSVIIQFTSTEIAAIDGSGATVGDADSFFEKDEVFVLQYEISPNTCGLSNTISSELLTWFGCSYNNRCQVGENAASLGLTNATPLIGISNVINPGLDFCDTVIYSLTLTNNTPATSPTGGSFAKDVTAFLGFRANTSPISTLSNITQWGSTWKNTKHFVNHKLNGDTVTLPTIAGIYSSVVPYLPPNYFDYDPDGPGGLEDIDGDGFYDDLQKDSVLTISFGVYLTPTDQACSVGRTDYIHWEHISADISWSNQCGVLMSPERQEFNYTNHIRDYLNSTYFDFPTDVSDNDTIEVGIKPHLYNNGITCNGTNGINGSNTEWLTRIILPPGLIMKSGYDPLVFTVSNDTVITNDSYAFDWTYFPLEFDCSTWDGSDPITLPFTTTYLCKDGLDTCYIEDVHCYNINIVPHCPGSCVGVTPLSFTTERVSESWEDNTQTNLVDLEDPNIVKDVVYPFDTIEFFTTGVFNDTMSDQLYLRITYSPESGGNIFSYEEGSIEIVDIDGQYNSGTTNYSSPLSSAPTVNSLGGVDYEMIFDLSSYRTSVNAGYNYGQSALGPPNYDSDTIKLSAKIVISNTMATATSWDVNNLRSEFFFYDTSSEEVSCNSWGSSLSYNKPNIYAGDLKNASSGCNMTNQKFYLTHQSYTGDDHPNEYRPPFQIDSAIVTVPIGWDIENVYWIDGSLMNTSDYEFQLDRTLILRRPASYKDYDKKNTFYPKFSLDLTPNCEAVSGKSYFNYTGYIKSYSYLTDTSAHVSSTSSDDAGYIEYSAPSMTITPLNQTATAYKDTVQWTVRICNSTSDMDVAYNWLLLENNGNQIQIDSVVDVTGGGDTLLTDYNTASGGKYVQIGTLDQGECTDITIYSSFTSCDSDTLQIGHGWSCTAYPTTAEAQACGAENEVYILPQSAQISATVTPLTDTPSDPSNPAAGNWGSSKIDMCSEFPAEIMVINAQPAYLYDVTLSIKIPSLGSGFTYVPGSATIEVEGIDATNTPRAIGATAESTLVTSSTNGDAYWIVTLAELDPINYGNGEPFSGTLNSSNNEFTIRWEMESTCDLISGDYFIATVEGDDPCGSPAEGSGEKVNGYPINLNGVVAPYFTFISTSISPDNVYQSCDDTKSVSLGLLLTGGTTSTTDTLTVTLPDGLGYDGGYNCTTPGKCPTYIGSSIVEGKEVLTFKYPSGQSGNIDFSFDISTDSRGDCNNSDIILFRSKTTLAGLACAGSYCAATNVYTGTSETAISIEKPILDVNFTYLLADVASAPYVYDYDIELSNAGIDTENDVIVEFYCLNAAGDDITGSAVGRDTLKSVLANGATATLSGTFYSLCDPTYGVAVLIVPEYENCYCSALEDLASKSAGLNEIPHDLQTNVTLPVEMTSFTATADRCKILIEWETVKETNNLYFDLERSYDGNDFTVIKNIEGAGNSSVSQKYRHIDTHKRFAKKAYYRLKQVDFDGSFKYSEVITVEPENCDNEEDSKLMVYPNPIQMGSEASVIFKNNNSETEAKVSVVSSTGTTHQVFPLSNLVEGSNSFTIDLSDLPAGHYNILLDQKSGKDLSAKLSIIRL